MPDICFFFLNQKIIFKAAVMSGTTDYIICCIEERWLICGLEVRVSVASFMKSNF
jgi:hypothetical protein